MTMALESFFEINMPYCFEKSSKGWQAKNREYEKIGLLSGTHLIDLDTKSVDFIGLNNHFINNSILNSKSGVSRQFDSQGNITRFYIYSDILNPMRNDVLMENYLYKLLQLFPLVNKNNTYHDFKEKYLLEKFYYNWSEKSFNKSTELDKKPVMTETITLDSERVVFKKVNKLISNMSLQRFEQLANDSTTFHEAVPFEYDYKLTKILVL